MLSLIIAAAIGWWLGQWVQFLLILWCRRKLEKTRNPSRFFQIPFFGIYLGGVWYRSHGVLSFFLSREKMALDKEDFSCV